MSSQARFQKMQREKARREKAAAKSARKEERRAEGDEQPATEPSDQAAVLAELAELHQRFDAGTIPFEDFVTAKEELTQRLSVE